MLPFLVREGQTVVGVQDLRSKDFSITREIETGSWLGRKYQGKGIGKEMRAAVLHFAFEGLGAQRANSGAFEDNPASLAVSRALGYVENGDGIIVRRGKPARHIRLLLTRQAWESRPRNDIKVFGLDSCRAMFGL
jgi:RimJ/RimL family protein N-acetyltransferase